jgi:hypothetical protein
MVEIVSEKRSPYSKTYMNLLLEQAEECLHDGSMKRRKVRDS